MHLPEQLLPQQQQGQQLDGQLLLVDLVSFDHCQEVSLHLISGLAFLQACDMTFVMGSEQRLRGEDTESNGCSDDNPQPCDEPAGWPTPLSPLPCCCCLGAFPTVQLVQIPPAVEQQVLMQFDVGAWAQPLPSMARQQADQQQRLPQESIGLWVPPHPRINSSSLYKLEQRLAKGRPLDMQKIVRALQEQFPESQQPGGHQLCLL